MENKKPLVSVIIPVYNRERVVARAVLSVLNQTFSDFEIVMVDDGSKDATWEALKKLTEKDERIVCLQHESNQGISAARNTAIKKSRGVFLAFLDSDDSWLTNKLQKQIDLFSSGDKSLGLVYTGAHFINEKTQKQRTKLARISGHILEEEVTNNPIGSPSRVMIRRDCLDVCGFFDGDFLALEDWDMWIRIAGRYKIGAIREPLVDYFESNDSISFNVKKVIGGYEKLWEKHNIATYPKNVLAIHFVRLAHRLLLVGDLKQGREFCRKAIKRYPLGVKNLIIFLFSFLPTKAYRFITYTFLKYAK